MLILKQQGPIPQIGHLKPSHPLFLIHATEHILKLATLIHKRPIILFLSHTGVGRVGEDAVLVDLADSGRVKLASA